MLEPLDDNNLRDHLIALADGELDVHQAAVVWAYLADHPNGDALRWLADQKRLTLATRRALEVPAPQDLRDRILALTTVDAPADSAIHVRRSWPRRVGYALAMAAAVAIGVTINNYASRPSLPSNVLPADLIVTVGRVHAECSRLPVQSHDAQLSEVDPRLAESVKADLGGANSSSVGVPDLTSAGFRFVGAGPCPAAKIHTVHLLYRSTRPLGLAAVSMFVQTDTGQFPGLKPGHVYRVSSPTAPFPTLAWRSGKVIYFLLADDDGTEANVLQTVRPTPAVDIVMVAN